MLRIGNVVTLLSGGPKMTIESIEGFTGQSDETKKTVKCIWFDGEAFKRDSFVYLSLKVMELPSEQP
ncbi:MAG TPA: DUF2158 domain-containing protein [Cytophagales bacterium]|nr:DUF2158 domain-containing protein [Cytophagales bacterium]